MRPVRLLLETRNAAVCVTEGRIVPASGKFDARVRIPNGELRPGLINAHEHLHRNHFGRLGRPPYVNAYDWGRDIHRHDAWAIARAREMPRRAALLRGAWKNLFAGVTTVAHHDRWERTFSQHFPLRVASLPSAHSLGFEPGLKAAEGGGPFAVHLAEGTDAASADEIRALEQRGLLNERLVAVHVVGADADGIARLRASGAAVVWCPSSNRFLFGRTMPAALLAEGIDVLLGSDSLLTGEGSLLTELRVARGLGLVSDARLEGAVGDVAARRLGLAPPSLEVGARADLVVLTRPLLDATEADVALVMVAGELRVLAPELVPQLGRLGERGQVVAAAGLPRWVTGQGSRSAGLSCAPWRERSVEPSLDASRMARA